MLNYIYWVVTYWKEWLFSLIIITTTTAIRRTIIIKWRGRYRTPTAINTELPVTLHNVRRPLSNIKKSPTSDTGRALYMPLKRLIHRLAWWIGVDHAAWIPCLELSPTWFLKNNCTGNINQNNNCNNNHNNDSKTIIIVVII